MLDAREVDEIESPKVLRVRHQKLIEKAVRLEREASDCRALAEYAGNKLERLADAGRLAESRSRAAMAAWGLRSSKPEERSLDHIDSKTGSDS